MTVGILGAGICGLSLAYRLRDVKPVVIDPASHIGGVMGVHQTPFFFEKGPRTFQTNRAPHLLQLIETLGLKNAMISADPSANRRYLLYNGRLVHPMRIPGVLWGLLTEWGRFSPKVDDTSVYDFFSRRIGAKATMRIIDALVTGIYAGDMYTLSMRHAFGSIMNQVEQVGSLTRAQLMRRKKESGTLFTLRGGTQQLIDALKMGLDIRKECDLNGFDHIYCTTPYEVARTLFPKLLELEGVFTRPLTTVNLAWRSHPLPVKAFGYLVPQVEDEKILGMVFDSAIFPQQSRTPQELRLTVMQREVDLEAVFDALGRHLGITAPPDWQAINTYPYAIAHYPVGHVSRMLKWEAAAKEIYPHVTFCGGYLTNPSVEGRISRAFQLAEAHTKSLHR